jgi:glyceraldehyde 3-phosphate dehydrogenase (phosphorylating)
MATRVAINGFGRTGRAFLRSAIKSPHDVEVAAVNDLGAPEALARLLARDSVHGAFPVPVSIEHDTMTVGSMAVTMLMEPHPDELPWRELGIDVVVECTGRMTSRDKAAAHIAAGARRVIVSAPAKDVDNTLVIGVNEEQFDPTRDFVVSNASCTTNCLAVLAKVLDDAFGLERGFMSTVHAYTDDQHLVDALHKDPRRSRGAAINIVPTTTGAARATGLVLPDVAGQLDGLSLRVPVPDGSITDLVAVLGASPSVEEVCEAYRTAARVGRMAGVLEYSEDDLVSTDILGSPASCIFDSKLTMANGNLVKVLGWYDNETGYSSRLVDLATLVGSPREH